MSCRDVRSVGQEESRVSGLHLMTKNLSCLRTKNNDCCGASVMIGQNEEERLRTADQVMFITDFITGLTTAAPLNFFNQDNTTTSIV